MAGKFRRGKYAQRKFKKKLKKKSFVRRNSKSIKRLAKTVYKLQRKERANHQVMRFNTVYSGNNPVLNLAGGHSPLTVNLSNHSVNVGNPVFTTPVVNGLGLGGPRAYHKKISIRFEFDIRRFGITQDPIFNSTQFTVAVVSPKDCTNQSSFSAGVLTMQVGIDYVTNQTLDPTLNAGAGGTTAGGHVMLNLTRWRVHKMKHFTLGNQGAFPATSTSQMEPFKRFVWKLYPKTVVQSSNNQTTSPWNVMTYDPDPSKNMYIVVFANGKLDVVGLNDSGNYHIQCLHKYVSLGP